MVKIPPKAPPEFGSWSLSVRHTALNTTWWLLRKSKKNRTDIAVSLHPVAYSVFQNNFIYSLKAMCFDIKSRVFIPFLLRNKPSIYIHNVVSFSSRPSSTRPSRSNQTICLIESSKQAANKTFLADLISSTELKSIAVLFRHTRLSTLSIIVSQPERNIMKK